MRAAELMDQARSKIGLDEFGSDSFIPGLGYPCWSPAWILNTQKSGSPKIWPWSRYIVLEKGWIASPGLRGPVCASPSSWRVIVRLKLARRPVP